MSLSVPCIPQPEILPLLGGAVGEETPELLIDLVHHRHPEGEETLIGTEDGHPRAGGDDECTSDDDDESHKRQNQLWWKRPSPWWSVCSKRRPSGQRTLKLLPKGCW